MTPDDELLADATSYHDFMRWRTWGKREARRCRLRGCPYQRDEDGILELFINYIANRWHFDAESLLPDDVLLIHNAMEIRGILAPSLKPMDRLRAGEHAFLVLMGLWAGQCEAGEPGTRARRREQKVRHEGSVLALRESVRERLARDGMEYLRGA
jgi:hypothetical protein